MRSNVSDTTSPVTNQQFWALAASLHSIHLLNKIIAAYIVDKYTLEPIHTPFNGFYGACGFTEFIVFDQWIRVSTVQ